MKTPDNKLAPTAQFYKAEPLPPAKPKKQRASTPTAMPTAQQPPRPSQPITSSYMPPTGSVNTVPSAAEQVYTNSLLPPETRQQRTTTGTILPPYTPPLLQKQPSNNTDFFTTHRAEVRTIAAQRGVTTEAGAYQIALELANANRNSYASPTAAASYAPAANALLDVNSDPLNEGPTDDDKKKFVIVAVVAVLIIVLLAKE